MLFYVLTLFVCVSVFEVRSYEFTFRPINENENEGYVEMQINRTWGIMSFPYTKLDEYTARILCRSFGFGWTGFSTSSQSSFELRNNAILWYTVIQCNGTESDPDQCVHTIPTGGPWESTIPKGWTMLHCYDFVIEEIRLFGGNVPNEGRLEVKVGDRWGAVCVHPFVALGMNTDAVCSLLGYAADSRNVSHPIFVDNIGPVDEFWVTDLRCASTDKDINQCYFVHGADSFCESLGYAVTLLCVPAQLINGTFPNVGIVEVGLLGKQQMICGASTFYTDEANVACNALGYRSVGRVSTSKLSPDNTGHVFSGSIQCNGTELSLEMCDIVQEQHDCPVSTVIYIECLGGPMDIVPIGNKSNEGIFTMYNWNKLWTVGHSFSPTTAKTLCKLLGHGYKGSSLRLDHLPDNVSLPWYTTLKGLDCHGFETDIAQCQRDIFYPCGRCPLVPPSGFVLLYCNECPPGYYGSHCTECTCNNRSTEPCDVHTGECTCMDGWSGTSCEMDIGECETAIAVCPNNSDCANTPGSYVCICRTGYTLTEGVCSVLDVVTSNEFTFRPINENENEGYVEMRINRTWGIMTDRYTKLDDNTARILCRAFGFGLTGFSTRAQSSFELRHNIFLWNTLIRCNGTESDPSQCALNIPSGGPWESTLPKGWTMLHCFDFNISETRLFGGKVPNEGKLEVKVDGRWGAVCEHLNEASISNTNAFCLLSGYAKNSVQCGGNTHNDINQCFFYKGAEHYCQGDFGYAVTLQCEPGQLIDGTLPNVGIVEVGLLGKQQMICGASSFYTDEANVACYALGYQSVGTVSTKELPLGNTGHVFSGSIHCNGTELSLEMCDIVQDQHDCPVSTVIYIECLGGPMDIVPVGNKSNEGIFIMYNWNKLWTVGKQFSSATAKTLCNLLGHGYEGASHHLARLPYNVSLPEYTTLRALDCQGNETDIAQCQRNIFYPCGPCPVAHPSGFALLYCNECPPGYYGSHCTECTCNNRSTEPCDVHTGECTCMDGWSGTSCEMDIGECETAIAVCPNNSDCANTPGSYVCICRTGYTLTEGVCSVLDVVTSNEFTFRPINENENEGYVEMRINRTWGIMSVPYTKLDDNTARILCRAFGFGLTGFSTRAQSSFELRHNIFLWNTLIRCNGTESDPSQCALNIPSGGPWESTLPKGWTMLHCFDFNISETRLYGGKVPNEGRLEVKVDGRWGAVCEHLNEASISNTNAFCLLSGYAKDSQNISHPIFIDDIEDNVDFWMSSVQCGGNTHNDINQCFFYKGAEHYCQGDFGYALTLQCEPGQLIDGTLPNVGIVEVGLLGKQQMICGASTFYTEEANVTCYALGYQSVGTVSTKELPLGNTGHVFSGSIQCNGTELSLEMCNIVQEQHDCPVSTVIYIECLGGPMDIVPVGNKSNEGIFIMYNWNKLWTVGKQFSPATANTLCNLLGHGYEGSSQSLDHLPENVSLPLHSTLEGLECHGHETDIAQCRRDIFYPCGRRCPLIPPSGFAMLFCNECPLGYYGSHCTECTCNNRSTEPCDVHTGECTCMDGWSGTSCEMDIGECETAIAVCPNNSDCANTPGSYVCICRTGYTLTEDVCSVLDVEDTEMSSDLVVIVLTSVIVGLTLVSIIAICCLCKYRMKGKKSNPDANEDAAITYRPGDDCTLTSQTTTDDYSAIDDRFVRTGQDLSNTESRHEPYDTIDSSTNGERRTVTDKGLQVPTRSDMNMNNKDSTRMASVNEYDYTYTRALPNDEEGYLKLDEPSPRVEPTDDDGYLKPNPVSKLQTEGGNMVPDNHIYNDYRPLQNRNQSEHKYEHMKQ